MIGRVGQRTAQLLADFPTQWYGTSAGRGVGKLSVTASLVLRLHLVHVLDVIWSTVAYDGHETSPPG